MNFKQGTIKRIHVDKHVIAKNRKHGTNLPPITVQTSKGSHKCFFVDIKGPSQFVYTPDKPLSCGARLYVVTRAEVVSETVQRALVDTPDCVLASCSSPLDHIWLS